MNNFKKYYEATGWLMALLLIAFAAGCTSGDNSSVSVADTTAPLVSATSPADGVTIAAASSTAVTATFDEAMTVADFSTTTFTVQASGVVGVESGAVAYDQPSKTATFTPASGVLAAGIYTATVTNGVTDLAGNALVVPAASGVGAIPNPWTFTVAAANPGPAGASPVLGTASTYGVFASSAAVTLVDNSTGAGSRVNGDVGINPAGACNGCDTFSVSGVIRNGGALAAQAQLDFQAAYTDASTRSTNACTLSAFTEIAGPQGACTGYVNPPGSDTTFGGVTAPTYEPGLYTSGSTIGLGVNKTIYLDAGGNADAVFIFQAGSAITTLNGSKVQLINGALAKNVWWMAGSDATLGYSSAFSGTVITNGAIGITVTAGSTSGAPTVVEGRLLSAAAVGVGEYVTVTVPAP